MSLKIWPLTLLPSRPLTFFRLSFWLPFLLSFVLSELIPSCWVDSLPNYFPSWFFILGSPRYQPLVHELLVSKLSSSLIGMYLFSFLVFLGTLFYLSWSHPGFVARPKDPEPLAIPGYPSPVFTIGLPSDFLTLVGWAFFSSSLCFMNSKAYLFVGLGSSLYPLMELGLPSFFSLLRAQVFYFLMEFNSLCHFGPWCNMVTFPNLNTYSISLFKPPKGPCNDINSIIAKYWWGQTSNERKIH